jgi:hypothetical protein
MAAIGRLPNGGVLRTGTVSQHRPGYGLDHYVRSTGLKPDCGERYGQDKVIQSAWSILAFVVIAGLGFLVVRMAVMR